MTTLQEFIAQRLNRPESNARRWLLSQRRYKPTWDEVSATLISKYGYDCERPVGAPQPKKRENMPPKPLTQRQRPVAQPDKPRSLADTYDSDIEWT